MSSYEFYQVIELISRSYPPESPKYQHACFLFGKVLNRTTLLSGHSLLSKIYHDGFELKPGGRAFFWYILKECGCFDQLDNLGKHVGSIKEVNAPLQLRIVLANIASELGNDRFQSTGLINTAGRELNPPVTTNHLPPPAADESLFFGTLLKFFEKVEQQCIIRPDNLDKLRGWLKDLGRHDLIVNYLDNFDPSKPIEVHEQHPTPSIQVLPRQCSGEDIPISSTPPCGEGIGNGFVFETSKSEESKPSKDNTELVKTSSFEM